MWYSWYPIRSDFWPIGILAFLLQIIGTFWILFFRCPRWAIIAISSTWCLNPQPALRYFYHPWMTSDLVILLFGVEIFFFHLLLVLCSTDQVRTPMILWKGSSSPNRILKIISSVTLSLLTISRWELCSIIACMRTRTGLWMYGSRCTSSSLLSQPRKKCNHLRHFIYIILLNLVIGFAVWRVAVRFSSILRKNASHTHLVLQWIFIFLPKLGTHLPACNSIIYNLQQK